MDFRDLTKDDIECRIAQVTDKGISLLLYKNARVDMQILDETVGAENWQREHYDVKGNMFCRVGISITPGDFKRTIQENICGDGHDADVRSENIIEAAKAACWVWKSDCGTESYTEKEKGESSDSFKRACFNWGIGRELYTAPFIWIPADKCDIREKNGKKVCYDKFVVEKIKIVDKKIVGLAIKNASKDARVFVWTNES